MTNLNWNRKYSKWTGRYFQTAIYQVHDLYLDKLSDGGYKLHAFRRIDKDNVEKIRVEFSAKSMQSAKKVAHYLMTVHYEEMKKSQ